MSPVALALMTVLTSTGGASMFVGERVPVALYVSSPIGLASRTASAERLQVAIDALATDTNLEVWSMERAGVTSSALDNCTVQARLSCWVQAMRPSTARYLWALSVQPRRDGHERLLTTFIDLDVARENYRAALDSGDLDWRERVEERLYEGAVRDSGTNIRAGYVAALRDYFHDVLVTDLRATLETNGHWHPYGELEVETPAPAEVSIDGRTVGRIKSGRTRFFGVSPGEHVVEARSDGGVERREVRVVVDTRATLSFSQQLVAEDPIRVGAKYGGVVVAATGAAILVWSLARAADGVRSGCIRGGADGPCPTLGGVGFGYDAGAAPGSDVNAVDPPGVVMGPFGAALVATGASWSIGAMFVGDRGDAPWWILAAGTVIGAAVYGVGHLAID